MASRHGLPELGSLVFIVQQARAPLLDHTPVSKPSADLVFSVGPRSSTLSGKLARPGRSLKISNGDGVRRTAGRQAGPAVSFTS
jgi:hypothetical protein